MASVDIPYGGGKLGKVLLDDYTRNKLSGDYLRTLLIIFVDGKKEECIDAVKSLGGRICQDLSHYHRYGIALPEYQILLLIKFDCITEVIADTGGRLA